MTFKEPFAFPIVLWGNQTVFIQGENRDEPMAESNGSGKSNLLEALTFALFGKISKKVRYLDDVINLESSEAKAEVGFTLDGAYYKVSRSRNRNKVNEIHIFKGTEPEQVEEIPDSDNTEKQLYIEKLIGLTFLSYSHTIMFCQRFVAFPELKAPERAKVLSEISGAHKYLVAAKLAAERATGLSMAISDIEHSKESVEKVIASLKLNDFDKSSREWEDGNLETIEDLSAELIVLEQKLKEYKSKFARRVKAEKLLIMALETKYNDALTWTEPLPELAKQSARQNADAIKTDAQINSLKSRIKEKRREQSRIQETKAGDCPYCGQTITQDSLEEHSKELAMDIDYMERELATLESIYKDEWDAYSKTNSEIAKINNLKRELRELHMDIALKKKDLEALEAGKDETAIQDKIESINKQIETIKKAKNPFTGMKEKQAQSLKEEEAKLKEIVTELERQLEDRQYFTVWAENFPKLRMMLLDDIVTRLETDAQTWLAKYCSELSVEIDTERQTQSGNVRDEVNITIVTPKGKVPYEGYGGGEIQKIRMAISLALSEIIAEKAEREYNVIIFDEPNVGLDRVGKESNIEVFKDLAESKTVLIIEHDEYFQDRMDETITVVKENHQSFIQGV